MEWWLIASGVMNFVLLFLCLWSYLESKYNQDTKEWNDLESKRNQDMMETYKEAMQDSINEQAKMQRLLKQYSDKVYEEDEDVWLAVFRSGVEGE